MAYLSRMGTRTRKFAGMIACVIFILVYCLLAMALGGFVVNHTPRLVHFIYFVLAGLAWLPPIMVIIRWMQREPA